MVALALLAAVAGWSAIQADAARAEADAALAEADAALAKEQVALASAQQATRVAEARARSAHGIALADASPLEGLGTSLDGWVLATRAGLDSAEFRTPVEALLASGRIAQIGQNVERLIVSPDGQYLVVDVANGPGSLLRMTDGSLIAELSGEVDAVTFGPANAGVAAFDYVADVPAAELRRLDTGDAVALPGDPAGFTFCARPR